MYVIQTENGKRVRLNTKKDEKIYAAPCNPPNTGSAYTRGEDLYAHTAKSGDKYFYLVHWSMWQGEGGSIELINREVAENFLIKKMSERGWERPSEGSIERIEKIFPQIFEETA